MKSFFTSRVSASEQDTGPIRHTCKYFSRTIVCSPSRLTASVNFTGRTNWFAQSSASVWAHFDVWDEQWHLQLTYMSPQMFSHWHQDHSWSQRIAFNCDSLSKHFPSLTTSNPKPFTEGSVRECRRPIQETTDERRRQAHADRSTGPIGEKPRRWVSHQLSKHWDQVCFSKNPRSRTRSEC